MRGGTLFLHSLRMSYGVTVALLVLVQSVKVRILIAQQSEEHSSLFYLKSSLVKSGSFILKAF